MTSNACFGSSSVARTSIGLRDGSSPTPIARAIAGMTRSVSATLPSGTNHAPSGYSSARLAATWSARRVLPVPPGPVSVTSRVLARSARISSSSRSRPTNDVSSIGRLLGRASSERIGGKSAGRPSITSCAIRSGRRSLSRWAPSDRRRQARPARWPSTSDRGRLGEQHLAAVAGGADARRAVDVVADVGARRRRARLRPCGGPSGPGSRPPSGHGSAVQRPLHVGDGRGRRRERIGEDGEERVALDLVLEPAVGGERRPDDRAVAREQRPPRRGAERRRRAASSPRCR